MSEDQARALLIGLYLDKAEQAYHASARAVEDGDPFTALNRLYYACFYALTAALLADGRQFVKHSGVRSALNQYLVHAGSLSDEVGEFYNRLFDDRHRADYDPRAVFEIADVQERLLVARGFLDQMRRLATPRTT